MAQFRKVKSGNLIILQEYKFVIGRAWVDIYHEQDAIPIEKYYPDIETTSQKLSKATSIPTKKKSHHYDPPVRLKRRNLVFEDLTAGQMAVLRYISKEKRRYSMAELDRAGSYKPSGGRYAHLALIHKGYCNRDGIINARGQELVYRYNQKFIDQL